MSETIDVLSDPSLTDILILAGKAGSAGLRVALPGKIESFDSSTGMAKVKPLLKFRREGEEVASELSVVPRVPVVFPRTKSATVYMPVASGDPVLLVFSDRCLDRWKASDGTVPTEPPVHRQHELTDCWAIPGGSPTGNPFVPIYGEGNFQIVVDPELGAKVAIGNGTDELLQIASDAFTSMKNLADELKNLLAEAQTFATIVTGGSSAGTYPSVTPANITQLIAFDSSVDGIISAIDAEIASLAEIKV